MLLKDRIAKELQAIRLRSGGEKCDPKDVVEFARDPTTALHSQFEWEDSKAAEEYRLWQARQIIRVQLVVTHESSEPVRAFVSLTTDRKIGGGYRPIDDVLADPELSSQMLSDALDELRRVRAKYQQLKELAPVWEAAERIEVRRENREHEQRAQAG